MVIDISINRIFSIHNSKIIIPVTIFLTKGNINTFDLLAFIQMRTD